MIFSSFVKDPVKTGVKKKGSVDLEALRVGGGIQMLWRFKRISRRRGSCRVKLPRQLLRHQRSVNEFMAYLRY